jgi:4-cresol dehydrogenase (hydroxylating)
MTVTLPTSVSEQVFSRALDDFVAALGTDAVLTADEQLAEFRDPFAYESWNEYTSSSS